MTTGTAGDTPAPYIDPNALVDPVQRDIETLARDDSFDSVKRDFSTKVRICYNSACPDYRRERTDTEDCACKKTAVKGAGDAASWPG